MSTNWPQDIVDMHDHFGFREKIAQLTQEQLAEFLEFRYRFLQEELKELREAIDSHDPDGVVDALIDLNVVALGTLDAFEVNAQKAWDEVHKANMSKKAGIKPNRPNPLGLPDLMKPQGFISPSHIHNHGVLTKTFPNTQTATAEVVDQN